MTRWIRSQRCESGSCTEVAYKDGLVYIRDSKQPDDAPTIAVDRPTWRRAVHQIRIGGRPAGVRYHGPDVVWTGWTAGNAHTEDQRRITLRFTRQEWTAFCDGVRDGDFDEVTV